MGQTSRVQSKPRYVRGMFAAIAGRYDLINTLLSLGRDGAWRRFAATKACLHDGGLAVDVATGTAELAQHLARQNSHGTVVGIDFCPEMLSRARSKLHCPPYGDRIELVLGDVLRLPFLDNAFDCATVGFGLRNVADVGLAFREMARVVKPGGRVVSLELTRPYSRIAAALHRFFLFRIARYIGWLVSGNREAYTYLPKSIMEFPSPEEVREVMQRAGMEKVESFRLTFGIATVHTGVKAAWSQTE